VRKAALALALIGVSVALAACGRGRETAEVPPPTSRRVVLLAVDGLDWQVLDPLITGGEAPTFARLQREGAWGILRSREPLFSPVAWTTIATGKVPEKHGIRSFTVETPGGRVPVTSNLRRVRTLWDILGERGCPVGVVGWWVTWPAEPVRGFLCSDRTWPMRMGPEGWPVASGPGEGIPDLQARTYPESLWAEVRGLLVSPEDLPGPDSVLVDVRGALATRGGEGPSVADILAKDLSFWRIARRLDATYRPRFLTVYLELPDVMAHYFWAYERYYRHLLDGIPTAFPQPPKGLAPDLAASIGRNFERAYLLVDRFLSQVLASAEGRTYVIVVSDHGYGSYPRRPRLRVGDDLERRVAHWHRPEGVILLWGPGVKVGEIEAGILDVAPTILWMMGCPVPRDMDGRVLEEAFTEGFRRATPREEIPSYETERRGQPSPVASPEDPAYLEFLRSLGYLR
jgi:hypothetical protein